MEIQQQSAPVTGATAQSLPIGNARVRYRHYAAVAAVAAADLVSRALVMSRMRLRISIVIVIFPIAGTYIDAFSLISGGKFYIRSQKKSKKSVSAHGTGYRSE